MVVPTNVEAQTLQFNAHANCFKILRVDATPQKSEVVLAQTRSSNTSSPAVFLREAWPAEIS